MTTGAKVLLIVVLVGGYLAFLAGMITWAIRHSRRKLNERGADLRQAMVTAGGRAVGSARPAPGVYGGMEHELDFGGRRVIASTNYSGRYYTRLTLRVPGGPYPAVTVFPEGKVERFGKHIGLNHEVQTGDRAFDDAAYVDTVETNDEYVVRLLGTADVRDGVRALLGFGFRVVFTPSGVEAYRLTPNAKPIDTTDLAKATEALGRVAEHAPAFKTEKLVPPGSFRAGFLGIGAVVGTIASVIFAGGMSTITDRTLDGMDQFFAYVFLGGFVWMLTVIGTGAWVRGTSSAMGLLLVVGFMGLIGIPAGTGALALSLNQWLDSSKGDVHATIVRSKKYAKSDHWIRVDAWDAERDGLEKITTSRSRWEALKLGDRIEVRVHPGAFGWGWAEELQ